jgi:hypothetical protein
MTKAVHDYNLLLAQLLATQTPAQYSATEKKVDEAERRVREEQKSNHPYYMKGRN